MAEALARHHAADIIDARSAGITPYGSILPCTEAVLRARGVPTEGLASKAIRDTRPFEPELVVNMTGVPGKLLFRSTPVLDWKVADPYGGDVETYTRICDDIEARVLGLAETFRAEAESEAGAQENSGT